MFLKDTDLSYFMDQNNDIPYHIITNTQISKRDNKNLNLSSSGFTCGLHFNSNILDEVTKEEYVIMRGASQRGKPHCCIFKNENGTFLPHFDPHPTLQYLKQNHYYYTIESKYNIYI